MTAKRISAVVLMLVVFIVPMSIAISNYDKLVMMLNFSTVENFALRIDDFMRDNFPYKESLKATAINTKMISGRTESSGIYVTKNCLIENVSPPENDYTDTNINEFKRFMENKGSATYFMLAPTAATIKRHELPTFATPYNQKAYIDDVYEKLAGRTSLIDLYSTLFANREKYIYYKTQSNLTALGGYYVYSVMGKRMGISPRAIEQFEIEYVDYDFYGDLYKRSPYHEVPADLFSLYHFSKYRREYKIDHYNDGEVKSYYTLYPTHLINSDEPMDVYLGGMSPRIDITIASSYTEKLLVFADETVLSYMPFLANHYAKVTIVDLSTISNEELMEIDTNKYNQILFSYSTDALMKEDYFKKLALIK